MKKKKNIAIVAHDNRKKDIIEWVSYNWQELIQHDLICTGTTGKLVEDTLREKCSKNNKVPPTVTRLKSGPLGGDPWNTGAPLARNLAGRAFRQGAADRPADKAAQQAICPAFFR